MEVIDEVEVIIIVMDDFDENEVIEEGDEI